MILQPSKISYEELLILRVGWERGRTSWCPAGVLEDTERTEREWEKYLPQMLDSLNKTREG